MGGDVKEGGGCEGGENGIQSCLILKSCEQEIGGGELNMLPRLRPDTAHLMSYT